MPISDLVNSRDDDRSTKEGFGTELPMIRRTSCLHWMKEAVKATLECVFGLRSPVPPNLVPREACRQVMSSTWEPMIVSKAFLMRFSNDFDASPVIEGGDCTYHVYDLTETCTVSKDGEGYLSFF